MSENFEDFNLDDIFNDVTSSTSLGEGVHEKVRLVSIDTSKRRDKNNKPIKMQLWLKFRKYDNDESILGEKEISFFMIDPSKNSAINNIITYLEQLQAILSTYMTPEEISAGFDPLNAVVDAKSDDDYKEEDLHSDNIKTTYLKPTAAYKTLQEAIKEQFFALLKDKIGADSTPFRLKLEESRDGKYIQIPHFDQFIERSDVAKDKSELYK